jgi:hypothetical protein
MSRKPVLYFRFKDVLGPAYEIVGNKIGILVRWADEQKGASLKLGTLEVGQCIGYEMDEKSERIGLIIEWHNSIEIVTLL